MRVPISRMSPFSGNWNTIMIEMTQEQLNLYQNSNELIQNVFPEMPSAIREFIKTGITPEEWDEAFGCGCGEEEYE